jgi:hypothetical protein
MSSSSSSSKAQENSDEIKESTKIKEKSDMSSSLKGDMSSISGEDMSSISGEDVFSILKENEKGFAIVRKTILYTGTLTEDEEIEDKKQVGYDEITTFYKAVRTSKKRKLDKSIKQYLSLKKPRTAPKKDDKDKGSQSSDSAAAAKNNLEFAAAASALQSIAKPSAKN